MRVFKMKILLTRMIGDFPIVDLVEGNMTRTKMGFLEVKIFGKELQKPGTTGARIPFMGPLRISQDAQRINQPTRTSSPTPASLLRSL